MAEPHPPTIWDDCTCCGADCDCGCVTLCPRQRVWEREQARQHFAAPTKEADRG